MAQCMCMHAAGSRDLDGERLKLKSEFSLINFRFVEKVGLGCAFGIAAGLGQLSGQSNWQSLACSSNSWFQYLNHYKRSRSF